MCGRRACSRRLLGCWSLSCVCVGEGEGFHAVAGDTVRLVGDSGKVWGAAVLTTECVTKPVYVSVGHRVSLDSALCLVRAVSLYRVPEPVRQADLLSRAFIRDCAPDV